VAFEPIPRAEPHIVALHEAQALAVDIGLGGFFAVERRRDALERILARVRALGGEADAIGAGAAAGCEEFGALPPEGNFAAQLLDFGRAFKTVAKHEGRRRFRHRPADEKPPRGAGAQSEGEKRAAGEQPAEPAG
jgi:hypothetical protein